MFDTALTAAARHVSADGGAAPTNHGHIHQTEILNDLFAGHFEAVTTVAEAFDQTLLGLGVAEAADGEIVAFDGEVWRIPANGRPVLAGPTLGLPFAIAAAGGEFLTEVLPAGLDFAGVTAHVDTVLRRVNKHHEHLVAAIRIDGDFGNVLMRSEPRQTPPYPQLTTVLEHEAQFDFSAWSGTLVGFRFPDVSDGIVIPGLHLHGVSADRASGGHCHYATIIAATMRLWIDDLDVRLPAQRSTANLG
jgi:acetolactate decarboxylase